MPSVVENYSYKPPHHSAYRLLNCEDGKAIVLSPEGESITVFDYSKEYRAYKEDDNRRIINNFWNTLPYYLIFFALLIPTIVWLSNKKEESKEPTLHELREEMFNHRIKR